MSELRARFAALVALPSCQLDRAALEIARIGHPDLDPEPTLRELDALADGLRPRIGRSMTPRDAARLLARHLFEECGFRGNRTEYYDPRNSFLNDVVERRTGIPITLSVLAMEVGRRLGIVLEGVGFPGHFLVRVPGRGSPLLLDCFQRGAAVDNDELLARLRALAETSGGPEFTQVPPRFVEATPVTGILGRLLRNLLRIYLERKASAQALAAVDLLLVLFPRSGEDLRTRARLYETLECFASAAEDLRRYLALTPQAEDAAEVRQALGRLAQDAPTLH
jgi:regulator of sirC expression with transglutaminase-like and TPR domain